MQDTLSRVAERWWAVLRDGDPEPYVRRWASDALAGQAYEPSTCSWTRGWPEILAGALALAALGAGVRHRRRLPSPQPQRPAAADPA